MGQGTPAAARPARDQPIRTSTPWLARLLPPTTDTRALALANLVTTVGTGIFLTGAPIFFVRSAGLSVRELSVGMTVAGTLGLVLSMPIGLLADRVGSREVAIPLLWVRAIATASFTLVHSQWTLILAASVAIVADRGGQAAFGALIALTGGDERVRLRAYLRSVTNVGVSLGAGIAGVLIAENTRTAYVTMMLVNAVALLLGGTALLRVPRARAVPKPPGVDRLPPLRDAPYLAATVLHGVLNLCYEVLSFALPLWVVTHTKAPGWIISVLVVLNTVMVVVFQVPASRGVKTAHRAAIVGRRSGLVLLAACALIALTDHRGSAVTVGVLIAAVGVLTVGEMWHAAASFTLSFELAQEHAHGQYQAVYAMGDGLERATAPMILGTLCLTWGPPGWLVLGGVFVLAGSRLPAVVRASERRAAARSRAANPSVSPTSNSE